MTRGRDWAALAAIVLASTVLRAWAALEVPVPWIAPDEMVYGLLGRNLWLHGSLDILGGPTPYYSFLTPVLTGFPLAAFGLASGYDVLQGLQAFVMSLAAVPVYLWARPLVSRRGALVAAALALAVPGLVYSGLLMTEVLFYPLFVVAAWAGAEAIARPSRRSHALLLLAVVAVCATRIQAIVLLPALVTAALLDAAIARSWAGLRRHVPAAAGLTVLLVGWLAWRLGSGSGTLGGYEVVASTSYSVADAAKFVLYHAASLVVLCGLFPIGAVALLLVGALRRGEADARLRAYLAVAASLSAWLVVEVGVFASRYSDRIVERNLIALAPILFVGLVVWVERGPAGSVLERAAIAVAAAAVLVLLPVDRYVNVFGTHDAMTLIPLYRLSTATSLDTMQSVYWAVVGVLALVLAFAPWRRLRLLPLVLVAAFAAASVVASRFVADEARAQQRTFLGPDPQWVDHAHGKRVVYVYDGEPSWNGVWETVFWNERIDRVYDLGTAEVPGPLPQSRATIRPDGTVLAADPKRLEPLWAVASTWLELDGGRLAAVDQPGLTQRGLAVWNLRGALRVRSQISGLQVNGDIYGPDAGRLVAYGCTTGAFRYTLIVKEDEAIDIRLDGQLVRHLDLKAGEIWRGTLPVSGRPGGACTLEIAPTHLTGTTQLAFERGG